MKAEEERKKAEEEEEKRRQREIAATKAREEKRRVDAAKAVEKAVKEATAAEARLMKAGGTSLCWDLHILLNLISPHKEAGAKKFGVGDHHGAYESYNKAVEMAEADSALLAWPAIEGIVIICHANAALCALKLGRNAIALKHCEAALKLPGGHSCGKSLLSKLFVRRLTALCEMGEDPLEEVQQSDMHRAVREPHTRGLATSGKYSEKAAVKSFAELIERVPTYPYDLEEIGGGGGSGGGGEEANQTLEEVVGILHTSFHPDRSDHDIQSLLTGLTELLDYNGMTPPSPLSIGEKGESLLYGLATGLQAYSNGIAKSEVRITFFISALEALCDREVPIDMRLPDDTGASSSSSSRTVLMYAAIAACPQAVKACIALGADVNLRDPRGVTPLIFACAPNTKEGDAASRRVQVATLLLDGGAHVDARDIAGQSSLMNACSKVEGPLVKLLLSRGADVSLRHGKGATCVGVLAAWLSDGSTHDDAKELIESCVGHAQDGDTIDRMREEVKAQTFFDLMYSLTPIHNKYLSMPNARDGEREASLVCEICKQLGMPSDYLTRPASSDAKWGNFYETLHTRLTSRIPKAFLTVYADHRGESPTDSDFDLMTQHSEEAVREAEAKAAKLQKEVFGGVRTSAYHPETLRTSSLVPWHARGRVPKCMKQYQNLIVLPLRRCISHSVPSTTTLKALSKLGPIIEVGAGSGYWSAMLLERRVDVIAYDLEPPDPETLLNGYAYRPFCPVHRADTTLFAVDPTLAERTLLIGWPTGQDDVGGNGEEGAPAGWEAACLHSYMEAGGQQVIYVGEREEKVDAAIGSRQDVGVSASRAFQVLLRTKFTLVEQLDAPRLFYTCDDVTVWRRR